MHPEPLPIVSWRHAQVALEGYPHALLVAEAAQARDLVHVAGRVFEQAPGRLEPEHLYGFADVRPVFCL